MKNTYLPFALAFSLYLSVQADFTIVFIPDTQVLSENDGNAQYWYNSMDWIVSQKDVLNIEFVSHLGDNTQNYNNGSQWSRADQAMGILTAGGVRWAPCKGNHDETQSLRNAFPVSEWENYPWFGGYYGGMENAYYLFTSEGMEFLVLVIQDHWNNSERESINWGKSILDQYPNRRAIVVSHNINESREIVDNLVKPHDNVFLTTGGHSCWTNGESNWTETTYGGNTAYAFMTDYQCRSNGGSGMLRYYTFKTAQNQICAYTINPTTGNYETDGNSELCVDYDMAPSQPEPPVISGVTADPASPAADEDVTVSATITDDVGVTSAIVKWGTASGSLTNEVAMVNLAGDGYSAQIPGQAGSTTVYYAVEASDGDGNTITTSEESFLIEEVSSIIAFRNSSFQSEFLNRTADGHVKVYTLPGREIHVPSGMKYGRFLSSGLYLIRENNGRSGLLLLP